MVYKVFIHNQERLQVSLNRFLIKNFFVYPNTWKVVSVVVRAFENLPLSSLQRIHRGLIVQYPETLDSGLGKKQKETIALCYSHSFLKLRTRLDPGTPTANQNRCNVGFSEKICLRTKFNIIESKQDENYCDKLVLD